jgi:regulatory protein
MKENFGKKFGKKYTPPVATDERLRHIALRYVSRYSASRGMLEKTLRRHLQKSRYLYPDHDHAPLEKTLATLLDHFSAKGWVNDETLAKSIVVNGRLSSLSRQKITQKLQAKGINREMIHEVLANDDDGENEWNAALTFIKRKHMGIYATKETDPKKEMARLCGAGFAPDIARKILNYRGDED